jgi:hypothetical protein
MADQKQVAISYCLFFIAVYALYICYSIVGGYINTQFEAGSISYNVPATSAMNTTTSATMALSDWSGMNWFVMVIIVGAITVILAIIVIMFGSRSMGEAF